MTVSNGVLIEAYFDGLAIAVGLPRSLSSVTTRELHLLAYLACLLAVFEGAPLADWGYGFALTSKGYPYSPELETAHRALVAEGCLTAIEADTFHATARGADVLADLTGLSLLSRRRRWTDAARDCALALPIGSIRYAMTSRDDLLAAAGSGHPRALVTENYVHRVHDERRAIETALGGESPDLMAPAVAWLSLYILGPRQRAAA